jgi:hypothetical protein
VLFQALPPLRLGRAALAVLCAWLVIVSACGESKPPAATPAPPDAGDDSSNAGRPPYANNCVGIDCACADAGVNKNYCSGQCVSLLTDLQNCGACGQPCGEYQTCVRGVCTCPTGEMWCDARCTQVATDYENCGACGKRCGDTELCEAASCKPNTTGCNPPCGAGQSCQAGQCLCPTGQGFCNGRCLDVMSNPDHCGTCDKTCDADLGCSNGLCGCTRGETACTTGCVDAKTDRNNCGSCGRVCGGGQECNDGECRAAWEDGCSDDAAHELRVRELAVFQTVKIPIAADGKAVDVADRPAQLVQNRAAMFRVYVDPGSNFSARDFAARLSVINDGAISRFSQKRRISAASTEAKPESTFLLNVPADKIAEGTKYSLQLVECAAASGSVTQARFPTSGEADLGARKAGALNIVLIPVRANARMPDTGPTALAGYREYLEAMYPVERVNFSIGKQISTDYPINWTTLVEQIRAQRKADSPAPHVYYYGLVKPTETLSAYCKTGCTAGIGYVSPAKQVATRAAVGLAFGDEVSASTMAHEVGHNHGRNHAPCSQGQISGVDADYPVKDGHTDVWGYDVRKQKFWSPASASDVMGYCEPKWMSGYTYQGLLDRIVLVNEIDGVPAAEVLPSALYRVLIVDEAGPRWSVPFDIEGEAYGTKEQADILDMAGELITTTTVYRTSLSEGGAATILVPPPEPDWYAVRVKDAPAQPFEAEVTVPDPE